MNRVLSMTLGAGSLCLALGAVGCGTDSGGGGTAGTTDASTTAGDAAKTDTGASGTATDAAATDAKTGGGTDGTATGGDVAAADTAKPDVAGPPPGCDPPCKAGEMCDISTKKCFAQTCKFPDKWGPDEQKLSTMAIAPKDIGCDLDKDGKPNNALAGALAAFLKQANDAMSKSVADGSLVVAMETGGYKTDGSEFSVNVLLGTLDPSNDKCDPTAAAAKCKYTVNPSSYDVKSSAANCPPVINFPNVKVKDGALSGGGKSQIFAITLPIPNMALTLKINQATLQGTAAGDKTWDGTSKGLICGVIGKKDIVDAINAVPDEQIAKLGIGDKATLIGLISTLLKPDIDVDGDGTPESASVAIQWESITAMLTGMTPAK